MSSVLHVEDLAKHYGGTPVFANVQFTVQPGEFVAIVGDSGVGKSTLLNCLAGLDHWDAGRIVHGDTDLAPLDETQRALWRRAHVGFVFQAFHVLPHLSVAQNVALPLMLLGRTEPDRVQHMLAAVGLADLGERLPQQLSGGQLQRVAIARALVHRPGLLLASAGDCSSTHSPSAWAYTPLLETNSRRCGRWPRSASQASTWRSPST